MYVSPVKKQSKKTRILVGRDDKRKKFHIVFVAKGIEIEMPPPHLRGKISEMGVDVCFGIKTDTIKNVYTEIQRLLDEGYTEEEAPSVI